MWEVIGLVDRMKDVIECMVFWVFVELLELRDDVYEIDVEDWSIEEEVSFGGRIICRWG